MSEEEIIRNVKRIIEYKVISNYINDNDSRAIQGLLDLYNKEKEKNKLLIEGKFREVADKKSYIKDNYINKDKIKEFIEENTKYISFGEQDTYLQGQRDENDEIMDKLQELLEERN